MCAGLRKRRQNYHPFVRKTARLSSVNNGECCPLEIPLLPGYEFLGMGSSRKKKKIVRSMSKYKAGVASRKQKHEELESQMVSLFTEEQYPIHEAVYSVGLFESGIGHVLLSRVISTQKIALCAFLLDVYCLGAKNVFFKEESPARYDEIKQHLCENHPMEETTPSFARKLVEELVKYAERIGLPPHKDYKKAAQVFGDVDSGSCTVDFTFGKDGKPFFVNGPNDTPQRCREILEILERNCGSGNFDYIIATD